MWPPARGRPGRGANPEDGPSGRRSSPSSVRPRRWRSRVRRSRACWRLMVPVSSLHFLVPGLRAECPDARDRLIATRGRIRRDRLRLTRRPLLHALGPRLWLSPALSGSSILFVGGERDSNGGIASIAGSRRRCGAPLAGMLLLQFSIGIVNDLVDAQFDRLVKPESHWLPALSPGMPDRPWCVPCGGLLAAASVGPFALAAGVAGLADGLLYDLRLKERPCRLPLAAGVAILPVYSWWAPPARGRRPCGHRGPGAAGRTGPVAGQCLADLERDGVAGVGSMARTSSEPSLETRCRPHCLVQLLVLITSQRTSPGPFWLVVLSGRAWLDGVLLSARRVPRTRDRWELQVCAWCSSAQDGYRCCPGRAARDLDVVAALTSRWRFPGAPLRS